MLQPTSFGGTLSIAPGRQVRGRTDDHPPGIRVLRDEGLVESWQGRGTFVRGGETDQRAADLQGQVREIREHVAQLVTDAKTDVETQLADLRRQLARAQAQIMELYARSGLSYPHDETATTAKSRRPRRASGE